MREWAGAGALYLRAGHAFETKRFAVDSPCGLEFVHNGVGVVRVRVKDSGGWRTAFEQAGISNWDDEERLPRAKVEWSPSSHEEFYIGSDVSVPLPL